MPHGYVSMVPDTLACAYEAVCEGYGTNKSLAPRVGFVIPDATFVWLPLHRGDVIEGPCMTMELKPKQAEKARSWLLDPGNASFKAFFTRIEISRAASRGKKPQPAPESCYRGLFSGDPDAIYHAIIASVDYQTGPVVNCFLDGMRVASLPQHLNLPSIVAAALIREPVLRRLRVAQQTLDCLDIDGVAIALAAPHFTGLDLQILLNCQSCASRLSSDAEAVASFCRCPPGLLARTQTNNRRARRNQLIAALYKLSPKQLLELLYSWLVALTMDDISIIVSTTRIQASAKQRHQSSDLAGVLRISQNDVYAYTIAVVDVGPKPTSKVIVKAHNESATIARAKLVLAEERKKVPLV